MSPSFRLRHLGPRHVAAAALALGALAIPAGAGARPGAGAEPAEATAKPDAAAAAAEGEPKSPAGAAKPGADDAEDDIEDDVEDDVEDESEGDVEDEDELDEEPQRGPPKAPAGPPRPGPLPELTTASPEWERRIQLGAGVAYVSRPLFGDLPPTTPRYDPTVGFAVDLRWPLLRFLRLHPYFYTAEHHVTLPPGALTTDRAHSISPQTQFPDTSAFTFAFGARLEPMLRLNKYVRLWAVAGVGWGRLRVDVQAALDPTLGSGSEVEENLFLRDRSFSFVEFPLGLGAGVEVIPNWLTIDYDMVVAPVTGQAGDALESVQAIDANGQIRDMAPLEDLDVSFVHTLTAALIL